jgi:hypothetical protein
MTVSSPNVIEIKLNRLIDDMRLLRSQMIAFDKRLKGIEAYLKPSEQQPESKSRPWFAAAAYGELFLPICIESARIRRADEHRPQV